MAIIVRNISSSNVFPPPLAQSAHDIQNRLPSTTKSNIALQFRPAMAIVLRNAMKLEHKR